MDNKKIGLKIKELRSKKSLELGKKYTGQMLADDIGISRSYLGDIENGRTSPSNEVLDKIANALNVSVSTFKDEYILNDKDRKSIKKDLKVFMEDLKSGDDGPVFYGGEELEDEDLELLEKAMEFALETIKIKNKEKYTPKKFRK